MNILSRIRSLIGHEKNFFIAVPALVWQVLFLYIPLSLVLAASFFSEWGVFGYSHVTLLHFKTILTSVHMQVIWNSLFVSLYTAVTCLLIGYPVAYFLTVRVKRFRSFLFMLLALPFWTNFLVLAYSWFFVLGTNGVLNRLLMKLHIISHPLTLLNSPITVALVMIYCYLPFMILPIYVSLERLDKHLIEASLDLGATPRATFFNVTLPLTMSGIKTGFFLVLVPAFGEYAIPSLFGGGKKLYVGTLIAEYFFNLPTMNTGAAFTVFVCLVLLIVIMIMQLVFRSRGSAKELS